MTCAEASSRMLAAKSARLARSFWVLLSNTNSSKAILPMKCAASDKRSALLSEPEPPAAGVMAPFLRFAIGMLTTESSSSSSVLSTLNLHFPEVARDPAVAFFPETDAAAGCDPESMDFLLDWPVFFLSWTTGQGFTFVAVNIISVEKFHNRHKRLLTVVGAPVMTSFAGIAGLVT